MDVRCFFTRLNPVDNSVESTNAFFINLMTLSYKINTTRVLAHVTTQIEAMNQGAPTGLVFQSIAGSEKEMKPLVLMRKCDSSQIRLKSWRQLVQQMCWHGQVLVSSDAHGATGNNGSTLLWFAKRFDPFLLNTVVGFIGPECCTIQNKLFVQVGRPLHAMA